MRNLLHLIPPQSSCVNGCQQSFDQSQLTLLFIKPTVKRGQQVII